MSKFNLKEGRERGQRVVGGDEEGGGMAGRGRGREGTKTNVYQTHLLSITYFVMQPFKRELCNTQRGGEGWKRDGGEVENLMWIKLTCCLPLSAFVV